MKIAVISDIHANLPALEAVLRDINNRGADRIICLGDLIGKGPSSKEVIEICRNECDVILMGNWENFLYQKYVALKQGQAEDISDSVMWYLNSVSEQEMEYLGALPHSTEFFLSGKLVRAFHAHPANFNRYHPTSPIEQRLELFEFSNFSENKQPTDVAIYADIHAAYLQVLECGQLLNVGSVGNPLDISEASYVILDGESDTTANLGIQFVRVKYDVEQAINIARATGSPDLEGYISELRTAEYFRRG